MAGEKLRLASLSVLGGSLHGRRCDVEEVVSELLIGSDPDCHLVVDLPSISPIHARLWTDLDQAEVNDTRAPRGVYVNTKRVEGQAILRPGDVLWLGPPQDPGSVCVRCRFEPWIEVLPGSGASSVEPGDVAGGDEQAAAGPGEETASGDAAQSLPADGGEEPVVAEAAAPDAVHEAVVVEDETGVVMDENSPGEAAPAFDATPDVEAVAVNEPDAILPQASEPSSSEKAPAETAAEPAAPPPPTPPQTPPAGSPEAPAEADPFFVGEAEPAAQPQGDEGVFAVDDAPAGDAADEWAIAEPERQAVESLPQPEVSDEFFVSEEAADQAVSVEPGGEAAPPIDLSPAWEAPPAPPSAQLPDVAPAAPPLEAPAPPSPPPPPTPPASASSPSGLPAAPSTPRATESHRPAAARPRPVTNIPKRPTGAASARSSPAARHGGPRPSARRSSGRVSLPSWLRTAALGLVALALVTALGLGAWRLLVGSVRVDSIEPARVRVGQRAIVNGRGFAASAAGNGVTFDDRPAKVVSAQPERLEVEVPDVPVESGGERRVDLVVRAGGSVSAPIVVTVLQGPRLHGLSPEAALPGEEVLLAGAGWGLGASVRFGSAPAQIVAVDATSIRAIVPAEAGAVGTRAPVVVTVGGVESNAAPFFIGRVPIVSEVKPAIAVPGDTVQVGGLGFQTDAAQNDVRVGGVPALVVSATGEAMKVVVPRLPAGDPSRAVEVRVPGSTTVGQATIEAAGMPETVDLRFVAEPFTAVAGRPHAVVATALGPAFVLAASGGRSAADRAVEAAKRLNSALPALRTTLGLNFEARDYETSPALGLAGQPEALLTVTSEDATAYNEDWTGLRGRATPVTRARLARWWEAVARDLVLVAVRGERPHFAAELAPEGRALGELYDAVRRSGPGGLTQRAVDQARPALRDAVRLLAFRVPAQVAAPAAPPLPGASAPAASATPALARMPTQGTLRGSEDEEGQIRYLTVDLRGAGTISYEGGITLTLPLSSLERGRDRLRFSVPIRGAMRHYSGKWDGEKIAGSVSTDAAGRNVVGTFELRPR